jgi:hypothetical protein
LEIGSRRGWRIKYLYEVLYHLFRETLTVLAEQSLLNQTRIKPAKKEGFGWYTEAATPPHEHPVFLKKVFHSASRNSGRKQPTQNTISGATHPFCRFFLKYPRLSPMIYWELEEGVIHQMTVDS